VNYKSTILTLIQYITMAYFILNFPMFTGNVIAFGVQLLGVALGTWAILVMSKSKINIAPVPRVGSTLINGGPYRYLRHPMYLSLLLIFAPMLINNNSFIGWAVFALFFLNLILKLSYEEQLLLQTFERYKDYQKYTWKLIPWIY